MDEVLLSVENLVVVDKKSEKEPILSDLSFSIRQGEVFGLVGESGAGKSLTSLSILGILPENLEISSGTILFKGKNLELLSFKEKKKILGPQVSLIFQDAMTSLNPIKKIVNQLIEPMMFHGLCTRSEAKQRALDLLNQVGIEDPLGTCRKYPHQLSGGQQQRVLIALALTCDPCLIIADEPTTALDPVNQQKIVELFESICKKMGISILFISHDLELVGRLSDRIGILQEGKLIEAGKQEDLFHSSQHEYTKSLLACRPPADFVPHRLATIETIRTGETIPISQRGQDETAAEVLIKVSNLSCTVGEKSLIPNGGSPFQLKNISLDILKGKNLGIIGASGSGKTTLGRVIAGLKAYDRGTVSFKAKLLHELSRSEKKSYHRKVQFVFQNVYSSLNPYMTIKEILLEPYAVHQIPGTAEDHMRQTREILDLVNLPRDVLHKHPSDLSGGQRQRICISRALTVDPELIIFDESVSALDVSIQAQILNLLLDIQEKRELSYVLISHDLPIVRFFCDYVAEMNNGEIMGIDNSIKFFSKIQSQDSQSNNVLDT